MRVLLLLASLVAAVQAGLDQRLAQVSTWEEYEALSGDKADERKRHLRERRLQEPDSEPLLADYYGGVPGFYHGVASGDPEPNAVILWTRYTPVYAADEITLELRIAKVDASIPVDDHLTPGANPELRRATVVVTSSSDWVAKIDMTGLDPATAYVYAFTDGTTSSDVGHTKTAPEDGAPTDQLIYATFSCSHFANGYFHAYDVASMIKDLDLWVHLGDYIYEYSPVFSGYATQSPERLAMIKPRWEQISLNDHRLRMATYHEDEGLRNLRRSAPGVATWDDHETTNNAYGMGSVSNTGAENHIDVCPANVTSPLEDKQQYQCDRDEGDVGVRFTNAAQAYMEWMPLRRGPGTMGVVTITSITNVMEWGDLATFVSFDTRITDRTMANTLGSYFGPFFGPAAASSNITAYYDPNSEEYAAFAQAAAFNEAFGSDPDKTIIGESISILEDAWDASTAAGKTWQIWGCAVVVGPSQGPNFARLGETFANPAVAPFVQDYADAVLQSPAATFLRALVAMDIFDSPWNPDDFAGVTVERAKILEVAARANNPVILSGDVHDSWAWTLYQGGAMSGTPVATNVVAPGVTSPGWGPAVAPFFFGNPLDETLGAGWYYDAIEENFVGINEGLKYGNIENKGFFATKATKATSTAEFFLFTPETILSDYETARSASGKETADFFCDASMVTTAGQKGSMEKQADCGAIEFLSERPFWWNIPVPPMAPKGPMLTGCDLNACRVDLPAAENDKGRKGKKEKKTKDKEKKGRKGKKDKKIRMKGKRA